MLWVCVLAVVGGGAPVDRVSYDFNRSTAEQHAGRAADIQGPFAAARRLLDYTYHSYYSVARQKLQDAILLTFNSTVVRDARRGVTCSSPTNDTTVRLEMRGGLRCRNRQTWCLSTVDVLFVLGRL